MRKIIQILSILLCVMLVIPACNLKRKGDTTKKETEEEEEEEEEETSASEEDKATMKVDSLDEFISDGSIYADNVPIPTPTPIPVVQTSLGMTNADAGYYSGPLENATIVDNEFFRYTIFYTELTDTNYYVYGEFENKTDLPYILRFKNPIVDNQCFPETEFYSEVIEPHTVVADVTDFASPFSNADCPVDFSGVEPTRISFLLLAVSQVQGQLAVIDDPVLQRNYLGINLFPQGEDAYVYQQPQLSPDSTIMYDSDGALFAIDYFEITDYSFKVHYTFINKTTQYISLQLDDEIMNLDSIVFDAGHQSCFIAPFSYQQASFSLSLTDIKNAGLDPLDVHSVAIPLLANSLNDGIKVLWQTLIKKEVEFG